MSDYYSLKNVKEVVKKYIPDIDGIEKVDIGVSTNVYKITSAKTYYLRISQTSEEYFKPQVIAHEILIKNGVKVPRVIHYEEFDRNLERSFMITEEIKGKPLTASSKEVKYILKLAGYDLGIINSIKTEGFGWIERYKKNINSLKGEKSTYYEFLTSRLDKRLSILLKNKMVENSYIEKINMITEKYKDFMDIKQGFLMHGDFDIGHIYSKNGQYSGIIDFGDIRSCEPTFDLAYFQIFYPECFEFLLGGWKSVNNLPESFETWLKINGLFMSIRKLAWRLQNLNNSKETHILKQVVQKNTDYLAGNHL